MTQAEKLNAALEKRYMTPGILARVMNVSPGWVTAIAKGWSRFDPWHRAIAERTLGLENGALQEQTPAVCDAEPECKEEGIACLLERGMRGKGDDDSGGNDAANLPDAGAGAGDSADGGGGTAGETG